MSVVSPTHLTEQQVKEFQAIYERQFNKEISYDEAYKQGMHLVEFMPYVFQLVGADFYSHNDHCQGKGKSSSRA